MSLDILAHTSINQRANRVLYNLVAVRFTGVLLRPSCAPEMHDHDGVSVSLLPILVSLDRKWHLKLDPF